MFARFGDSGVGISGRRTDFQKINSSRSFRLRVWSHRNSLHLLYLARTFPAWGQ